MAAQYPPIVDNCQRANENPLSNGGRWGGLIDPTAGGTVSQCALTSNFIVCPGGTGTDASSVWNPVYGKDFAVAVKLQTIDNNHWLYARIRYPGSASQQTWYNLNFTTGGMSLTRAFNGAFSDPDGYSGPSGSFTLNVGGWIMLVVQGASQQGWSRTTDTAAWILRTSATDATISEGQAGIGVSDAGRFSAAAIQELTGPARASVLGGSYTEGLR